MPRVLTVDDSASMRQMVRLALCRAGFDVVEASTGEEALTIARECVCDLVLSDVHMPAMDGIELTRALRELPRYRRTPILMLTTENASEKKHEGRAAGANGWIVKPFHPSSLLGAIEQVLKV